MAFSTTPTSGNDRLRVWGDNQTIDALAGNDWIRSTFNGSTLYGGLGHDRITVTLALPEPTETDNLRTTSLFGGNGNDWLVTEIAGHVTQEFRANFTVQQVGGRGNDNLYVSATSTTDNMDIGGDYDIDLFGGAGSDNIWIESEGRGGWVSNFVDAGAGSDIVYIYTDAHFFGGSGSNEVEAGPGDDEVTSRASFGSNTLSGGEGNDRIEAHSDGGDGLNKLYGEDGNDTLIAIGAASGDAASYLTSYVSGESGNDTIELIGSAGGNRPSVVHTAYGGSGNDTITSTITLFVPEDGDAGQADTYLYGGSGNDVLTATTVDDPRVEEEGGARVYGGTGNDQLRVYGGAENTLDGGAGYDTITGGSGVDRIIGGAGADRLRGGGGDDAFVFLWMTGAVLATRDTIFDFGVGTAARGDDVIDLSAIDADATIAGNQAFAFGGTTRKGVGYVWVEESTTSSGSLVMGNTGGAQPLVIAVEDGASRDAADWRASDFVL